MSSLLGGCGDLVEHIELDCYNVGIDYFEIYINY